MGGSRRCQEGWDADVILGIQGYLLFQARGRLPAMIQGPLVMLT